MQVKLNAFRGDARPGDIVDLPDGDAATLVQHGAATPAEAAPEPADRTVTAAAELQAASDAGEPAP